MYILKEGTTGFDGTSEDDKKAIIAGLTTGGLVIKTPDQVKTDQDAAIATAFSARNSQLETTILEVTDVKKLDGEKYYDYLKRSVSEKLGQIPVLQSQIDEFKRKGIDGNEVAKEKQKELDALRATVEKERKEMTDQIAKLKNEAFMGKIGLDVESFVNEIRPSFQKLPEAILKDSVENRIRKFHDENKPHELEGVVVYKDLKGEIRRRPGDAMPMTAKELLKPYFEEIIDKDYKAAGTGSGGTPSGGTGSGVKKDWKTEKLPAEIKSKMQWHETLQKEHKLDPSSKEFSEAYGLAAALPLKV